LKTGAANFILDVLQTEGVGIQGHVGSPPLSSLSDLVACCPWNPSKQHTHSMLAGP
jgi:hypothetical protein